MRETQGHKGHRILSLCISLCLCIAKLSLTSIKHTSGDNECMETSQREKSQLHYIGNISLLHMLKVVHCMLRLLKRCSLSGNAGMGDEGVHTTPFLKSNTIC